MNPIKRWNRSLVRCIGPGGRGRDGWYIRYTPNLGARIMLPRGRNPGRTRALRIARHHRLQVVAWRDGTERWVVEKQLFGATRVKGEKYLNLKAVPGEK
jgi:hypothetical protein